MGKGNVTFKGRKMGKERGKITFGGEMERGEKSHLGEKMGREKVTFRTKNGKRKNHI